MTSDLLIVEGARTNKDAHPGGKVSCDQYMSPTKGRLIHTCGKESSMKQLYIDTIFVDHAANYILNKHHVNLTAATTIGSKHQCESKFDKFGIKTKQYVAANHPFCFKIRVDDCAVQLQLPTFHSGVGVHYQILAEKRIQTICNWSRADLLHFVLHWPPMATSQENL